MSWTEEDLSIGSYNRRIEQRFCLGFNMETEDLDLWVSKASVFLVSFLGISWGQGWQKLPMISPIKMADFPFGSTLAEVFHWKHH